MDERAWRDRLAHDLFVADYRGRLVWRDDAVLIGWPADLVTSYELRVTNEFGVPLDEVFYVHLACGRLGTLGDMVASGELDLPWRWMLWQRGMRGERWRLQETERVVGRVWADC
jgi:hypothetical protein